VLSGVLLLAMALTACGGKTIPDALDDATLTARVKTALLNDPQIGALKIDVDTTDAVVTISGTVKSEAEAARAVQITRGINGVRDVHSTLQVSPGS
jgi:hyperosmotically inducible protein